jgi:hypothetical protein
MVCALLALLGLVWTVAFIDDRPHRDLTDPLYTPLHADEDDEEEVVVVTTPTNSKGAFPSAAKQSVQA